MYNTCISTPVPVFWNSTCESYAHNLRQTPVFCIIYTFDTFCIVFCIVFVLHFILYLYYILYRICITFYIVFVLHSISYLYYILYHICITFYIVFVLHSISYLYCILYHIFTCIACILQSMYMLKHTASGRQDMSIIKLSPNPKTSHIL